MRSPGELTRPLAALILLLAGSACGGGSGATAYNPDAVPWETAGGQEVEVWPEDGVDAADAAIPNAEGPLEPVVGCDAVLERLRVRLVAIMEEQLAWKYHYVSEWSHGTCGVETVEVRSEWEWQDVAGETSCTETPDPVTVTPPAVDLAVSTDGGSAVGARLLLYVLAQDRLQVVSVGDAGPIQRVSVTALDGQPARLVARGERVAVLASLSPGDFHARLGFDFQERYLGDTAEVGQDLGPGPFEVTLWDVADAAHPRLERRTTLGAQFLGSHVAGEVLYVAAYVPVPSLAALGVAAMPPGLEDPCRADWSQARVDAAFKDLHDANVAAIRGADLSPFLPAVRDARQVDGAEVVDEGLFQGCAGFLVGDAYTWTGFVILVSLPLASPNAATALGMESPPAFLAVDGETAILAAARLNVRPQDLPAKAGQPYYRTRVHSLALDTTAATARYQASGTLDGQVPGETCLSFAADRLRVATAASLAAASWGGAEAVVNAVSVLGQEDGTWREQGRLTLPDADAALARCVFNDTRGYLASVAWTNAPRPPFYVVDLSDAAHPALAGQVGLPMNPSWMTPLDGEDVLTLGYQLKATGDRTLDNGVRVQSVMAEDGKAPLMQYQQTLGASLTFSQALTDSRMLGYDPTDGTLAFPLITCAAPDACGVSAVDSDRLVFLRVNAGQGISSLGAVDAPSLPSSVPGASRCPRYGAGLSNGFRRALFLNQRMAAATARALFVLDPSDPSTPLAVIDLTAP